MPFARHDTRAHEFLSTEHPSLQSELDAVGKGRPADYEHSFESTSHVSRREPFRSRLNVRDSASSSDSDYSYSYLEDEDEHIDERRMTWRELEGQKVVDMGDREAG